MMIVCIVVAAIMVFSAVIFMAFTDDDVYSRQVKRLETYKCKCKTCIT